MSMRHSLGIDAATPLLGVVGNVIPRKGLIHLVRAMPRILAAVPDARLLVVGGQEQGDYGQKVRAGRGETRDRRARSPGRAIATTSAKSSLRLDLFVLPSLDERLPLADPGGDGRGPGGRRHPRWAGFRSAWFPARPASWCRPAKSGPWPRRSSSCCGDSARRPALGRGRPAARPRAIRRSRARLASIEARACPRRRAAAAA